MPVRLVDRAPAVPAEHLVAALRPPPAFAAARLATYHPDPDRPSQAAAVAEVQRFAAMVAGGRSRRRRQEAGRPAGIYLDGGFGVGKTHLLAALWHEVPEPAAYATFVELTHLVGALGFAGTAAALGGHRLLAIDEFELDDPGDTVLVSSLLTRLVASGVRLAATSNTLPGALGEGRFAAEDFQREIQGLARHFTVVRIDGEDYRHRGLPDAPPPLTEEDLAAMAADTPAASYDEFPALLEHLRDLHPSRYAALLDGVTLVCLAGVRPVTDQADALRLVVLADRLYDGQVPVASSGVRLDALFPAELLAGGYRKKYLRALSRLMALARQVQAA